jgi:hypothetical protein
MNGTKDWIGIKLLSSNLLILQNLLRINFQIKNKTKKHLRLV